MENFVKWRQRPDGPWTDYHQSIDSWTLRDVCESFLEDNPLKDIQPTHDIAIRVNGQYAVNNKVLLRQYRSSGKPVVLLRDLYIGGSIPLDRRISDVNFGGTNAAL